MVSLLEVLCGGGVLTTTEVVEHGHQPDGLVEYPASVGELGVAGNELDNLVLDLLAPVLLNPKVEQLDSAAVEIESECSPDARVAFKSRADLEASRVLAGEVEGYFPSALEGRRDEKCSARALSMALDAAAVSPR